MKKKQLINQNDSSNESSGKTILDQVTFFSDNPTSETFNQMDKRAQDELRHHLFRFQEEVQFAYLNIDFESFVHKLSYCKNEKNEKVLENYIKSEAKKERPYNDVIFLDKLVSSASCGFYYEIELNRDDLSYVLSEVVSVDSRILLMQKMVKVSANYDSVFSNMDKIIDFHSEKFHINQIASFSAVLGIYKELYSKFENKLFNPIWNVFCNSLVKYLSSHEELSGFLKQIKETYPCLSEQIKDTVKKGIEELQQKQSNLKSALGMLSD